MTAKGKNLGRKGLIFKKILGCFGHDSERFGDSMWGGSLWEGAAVGGGLLPIAVDEMELL
jgi:hypothetical protein